MCGRRPIPWRWCAAWSRRSQTPRRSNGRNNKFSRATERAELEARARAQGNAVYGLHAVSAVVKHQAQRVVEVAVDDQRASSALAEFLLQTKAKGIHCRLVGKDLLDRMTKGARHQGVVAQVRPFPYAELLDLGGDPQAALLVLDGVEDPRNLGAAARAAQALGASGLVIPKDRAAKVTPAAEHVAAGALAALPVVQVTNVARSLSELKQQGLWIVGAEADAKRAPWQVDLTGPIAVVVGGEDRGLRRLVRNACDFVVSIPMAQQGLSLNAADAACVLLYELLRQRADAQQGDPTQA